MQAFDIRSYYRVFMVFNEYIAEFRLPSTAYCRPSQESWWPITICPTALVFFFSGSFLFCPSFQTIPHSLDPHAEYKCVYVCVWKIESVWQSEQERLFLNVTFQILWPWSLASLRAENIRTRSNATKFKAKHQTFVQSACLAASATQLYLFLISPWPADASITL